MVLAGIAAVTAVFLIAAYFARYTLAVTFAPYDDEGYCLLSVSHYLHGGHLYTEVFSQYGPFYFLIERAMYALLHLPVDHDSGRLITVILWLFSALMAGLFLYRLSKNLAAALFAFLCITLLGRVLANEPGHPQQLVLPLLMMACCASVAPGRIGMALLGALGAGLCFTKINIGAFYFFALMLALVCGLAAVRVRKIAGTLLVVCAALLPLVLMRRDIPGWANRFAFVAVVSGAGTFLMCLRAAPSSSRALRNIGYTSLGALSTAFAIILAMSLQGMSLSTLLEGVLWAPLRHPGVFEITFPISTRDILFVALELALVAGLFFFREFWEKYADGVDAARCVIGILMIWNLADHSSSSPWFLGLLPLGVFASHRERWTEKEYFTRVFVTALAVTQFLEIYPVAGSQIAIGYSVSLVWGLMCVHDGIDGLLRFMKVDWRLRGFTLRKAVESAAVIVFAALVIHRTPWRTFRDTPASSLAGSRSLHLPAGEEELYETISNNVRANCDMLFSMPGMGSFNFWSGVPTPDGFNLTAWMKGIGKEEQQKTLRTLQSDPGACVLYNPRIVSSWETTGAETEALPLARYVMHDMRKVSEGGGYEIRVSPERTNPWNWLIGPNYAAH